MGRGAQKLFAAVQHDFALSSRTVFYGIAGTLALAFVVSLTWMPSGKAEEIDEPGPEIDEAA